MRVDDIIPAFLTACPGFVPLWQDYLASWGEDTERGVYNDVSIIADYLVDRYEAGDVAEIATALAAVERFLAAGDEETRKLATIGITEGIQNVASHRPYGAQVFERWLKPRSRLAWLAGAASWRYEFALADLLHRQLDSNVPRYAMPDLNAIQSDEMREMVERLYPRQGEAE